MAIVAVGLGLLVGAFLGLLGGGGSILAVPALVYGLGQPVAQAVPTSLVVVGIAAAVGAVPRMRAGNVRWGVAGVFGGAGVATSFAGAWLNHRLPDDVVLIGFAVLMTVVGLRMLSGRGTTNVAVRDHITGGRWLAVVATGAGVGFLTGLFGVGGGFVIVPALVLVLGLPISAAIGTSLVVIVITAGAAFTAHVGEADLNIAVVGAFTAGAVIAALAGGRLARHLDDQRLRRWFAALVLIVASGVAASVFLLDNAAIG